MSASGTLRGVAKFAVFVCAPPFATLQQIPVAISAEAPQMEPSIAWGAGGGGSGGPKRNPCANGWDLRFAENGLSDAFRIADCPTKLEGGAKSYKGRFRWDGKPVTIVFDKPPDDSSPRHYNRDPSASKDNGFPGMQQVDYSIKPNPNGGYDIVVDRGVNSLGQPIDGAGQPLDTTGQTEMYTGKPAQSSPPIPIRF